MPAPRDITDLLASIRGKEEGAVHELLPLVYRELHALAQRAMHGQRSDHTLQATALVNEAYLRLVGDSKPGWQNRAHFFAVSARVMRQILVDHARARQTLKRGGGGKRYPLTTIAGPKGTPPVDLLALDDAMTRLGKKHPREARVVELRFFAGLTREEVAEVLAVSMSSVL